MRVYKTNIRSANLKKKVLEIAPINSSSAVLFTFQRLAPHDHMLSDIRKYPSGADGGFEDNANVLKDPKKFSVMDVHKKKNGHVNPVIVTFQNGELNDGSDFNVTLTANRCGYTNVSIETSYGHAFKDSDKIERPRPKQTILIRNKKTNKVKLVEVDCALLINSALLYTPETSTPEMPTVDFAKGLRILNKTFGGKKIVSRLEQREKLNISSLPIADEVKKAIEDIKVDENITLNDTEVQSIVHLLPPCHRDATLVSEVYKLHEILSEEELQVLKEEVVSLEETKFNPKAYSQFYATCYVDVKKTTENLNTRLAGLLFVEIIIRFLKIPSKKVTAKNKSLCPFSSVIQEKLLNDFCIKTENSITRPVTMRDKSLCYIIAISLICCNYKINLKLLSGSTSQHLKKLSRLARAVGAVPVPKEEHIFVLKLPLAQLPKATPGKTRRK